MKRAEHGSVVTALGRCLGVAPWGLVLGLLLAGAAGCAREARESEVDELGPTRVSMARAERRHWRGQKATDDHKTEVVIHIGAKETAQVGYLIQPTGFVKDDGSIEDSWKASVGFSDPEVNLTCGIAAGSWRKPRVRGVRVVAAASGTDMISYCGEAGEFVLVRQANEAVEVSAVTPGQFVTRWIGENRTALLEPGASRLKVIVTPPGWIAGPNATKLMVELERVLALAPGIFERLKKPLKEPPPEENGAAGGHQPDGGASGGTGGTGAPADRR